MILAFVFCFVCLGRVPAAPEPPAKNGAAAPTENPAAPAEGAAVPILTLEKVQEKLKEIEAGELEEELKKKVLEAYRKAESSLQKEKEHRADLERYKTVIETAPKRIAEIREDLKRPAGPFKIPAGDAAEDLLTTLRTDAATAKTRLEKMAGDLKELEGRLTKVQEQQAAAKTKLEEIEKDRAAPPPAGEPAPLIEANADVLSARKRLREAEIAMLEQEKVSHPRRLELLTAERDKAKQEADRLAAQVKQLEEELARRRSDEAGQLRRKAEREARAVADRHSLIKRLADENLKFAKRNEEYATAAKPLGTDKRTKQDQRDQLKTVYEGMEAFLKRAGLQKGGGDRMREWRKRLPAIVKDNQVVAARWRGKLGEVEATHFETSMGLGELSDIDQDAARRLNAEPPGSIPEDRREEIAAGAKEQLENRKGYLQKLKETSDSYLKSLRELDAAQTELGDIAQKFAVLLDERLLWISSTSPVGVSTVQDLDDAVLWFLSPHVWAQAVRLLASDAVTSPALIASAILLLVLFAGRRRMGARIEAVAANVDKIRKDRFGYTVTALIMTLLLAAPLSFALLILGWRLSVCGSEAGEPFVAALGAGLLDVAHVTYAVLFLLFLCYPKGVGDVHFRWRDASIALLRRHLRWLFPVLIVSVFVVAVTEHQPKDAYRTSLGRLVFIAGVLAQAVFVQRILRPRGGVAEQVLARNPDGWLSRLRYIWYPLAVGVPVVLAVLAAAGYYYTALELNRRMIRTVWLVAGAVIANYVALRWLVVEGRRLALQKAREKREAELAAAQAAGQKPEGTAEGIEAGQDIPEVDISTINEQSRTLLRTLAGTAIILGLWFVWSDVLPALGVLDQAKLWSIDATGASGTPVASWITLKHVALALIALMLTMAASRNLPGVLEILILKRLPLEAGTRYAVTMVSQYVLAAIGIIVAFNIIGVGWSKVQWLVAALSVGIGFGLQEIIANFFCGLILLFERPIRVGDIVTVGDVMGTVSRIRIRATTITNWDRMEYIVPNKELITGRLLNWTLSNTVNRIVINVGAAYGSDTEKARELLLKVAAEHPLIMDDPAPLATFEGFGDSTLNLVLRCYLPDFANRLNTIHELHVAVDKAFKEAGIEIAFPQMDIHFRTSDATLTVAGQGGAPPPVQGPPAEGKS
jgi:potassium efflux system protein